MRFGARRRREKKSLFDAFSKGETLFLSTVPKTAKFFWGASPPRPPKIRDIFDYPQNHPYLPPPLVSESKRGKGGGVNIDGIALIDVSLVVQVQISCKFSFD